MDLFGFTEIEKIFFSIYLIAHGLVHWVFLLYKYDEKEGGHVGWSRQSWLLDKVINKDLVRNIGFLTWILIAVLFVLSGLSVLDVPVINEFFNPLIIISSVIATLAFIIFFDGLFPTPYHWILGVVINLALITFLIFFSEDIQLILAILIIIFLYGMLLHTKIISQVTGKTSSS